MFKNDYQKIANKNIDFTLPKPELEFLSKLAIDLGSPIYELEKTSNLGKRRIIPIIGGEFNGPHLSGKIINNGADWQVVTDEGLSIIDTRYLLMTHDDALIYIQTRGFRHGPPEVMDDLARGKRVDPQKYYFRVNINFETAAPRYKWLNIVVAVGTAMRLSDSVILDAYYVK